MNNIKPRTREERVQNINQMMLFFLYEAMKEKESIEKSRINQRGLLLMYFAIS